MANTVNYDALILVLMEDTLEVEKNETNQDANRS